MSYEELIKKCRELYGEKEELKVKIKWLNRKIKEEINPYLRTARLEMTKINSRKYRSRPEIKIKDEKYNEENREKMCKQMCDLYRKRKLMLFEILGGKKCVNCNTEDIRVLSFDHINGGGTRELKRFKSNRRMILYYIRNPEEAKEKLQVLCFNCNMIKRHELNETANKEYLKKVENM